MADSGGLQTFVGWMKGLQALAQDGPGELADRVRDATEAEMASNLQAGVSPDGDEWAPTVEDKRKAYPDPKKFLKVSAFGNQIVITIRGPLVFANWGTRKMVARKSLPERGLPRKLGNAIRLGYAEMTQEFMTRAGRHDRGARGTSWVPRGSK